MKIFYKTLFTLLLITSLHLVQAQRLVHGRVYDSTTGKPVAYVNIGFPGKVCGTVSDEGGKFRLALNNTIADNDSIVFSHIGYERQAFLLGNWRTRSEPPTVSMKPVPVQLNDYVVHAGAKESTLEFGHFSDSRKNKLSLRSSVPGAEMATVIDFGNQYSVLQNLRFHVISASTDTLLFRLNIYPLVNDIPQPNLCTNEILIRTQAAANLCQVNLAAYHLRVKGKCLVSLEWLRNTADEGTIDLSATQKAEMFYRAASQASWIPFDKASPAIHIISIRYQ